MSEKSDRPKSAGEIGESVKRLNAANRRSVLNTIDALLFSGQTTQPPGPPSEPADDEGQE